MKAQATTGTVLRRLHRTGQYVLTSRDGRDKLEFAPHLELHQIAKSAGLSNGYWLRDTPQCESRRDPEGGLRVVDVATVWTWVQL